MRLFVHSWQIFSLATNAQMKDELMENIIYKEESYKIIGSCFDVHNNLGAGFSEIVYKDALEYEFAKAGIPLCPRS